MTVGEFITLIRILAVIAQISIVVCIVIIVICAFIIVKEKRGTKK